MNRMCIILFVKNTLITTSIVLGLMSSAFAQSEQTIRPSTEFPWGRDVPALEYIGNQAMRLQSWDTSREFPVDFSESWQFTYSWDIPVKSLLFEPVGGEKAIELPLQVQAQTATATEKLLSVCRSGNGVFGRSGSVILEARAFGVFETQAKTFRVTPIGFSGEKGETVTISFNFRGFSQSQEFQQGQPILNFLRPLTSSYWLQGRFDNRLIGYYSNTQKPIRGLRLRSINSTRVLFLQIPENQQNLSSGQGFFNTEFNGADFGINVDSSETFNLSLVTADGIESKPYRISFNTRMGNQFQQSIADLRAAETLISVLPIQFFQGFGQGALSIYSAENFQTYARIRSALKSQFSSGADRNLIITSIAEGFIKINDNQGKPYKIEAEITRDGQCGMRPTYNGTDYSMILVPKISDTATQLIMTFKATPEIAERLAEPFKSGFSIPLNLKR